MEQLKVIGSEDDALVVATESGERFTLPIEDVVRATTRARRQRTDAGRTQAARPRPRDIQSRIRAGLSTQEVADALGIDVEDVARYEGPVLAEREHVLDQALAVAVIVAGDPGLDASPTFGAAIRARLADAHAVGEHWTSWKDVDGWVVKVEFTAADVEHDARWSFDPRAHTLGPLNADATRLSRQGTITDGVIPRLHAVGSAPAKDESRFDSAAFGPRRTAAPVAPAATVPPAAEAAIKRAPAPSDAGSQTADLLEALRRRRGQRTPPEDAGRARTVPVAPVPLDFPPVDEPDGHEEPAATAPPEQAPETRRKGRPAMPSWDEIVFGARREDS